MAEILASATVLSRDGEMPIWAGREVQYSDISSTGEVGERDERKPDGLAEPNTWGFSVDRMNREWAIVLMGGKAVMVREQSAGPIEDRLRFVTIDGFRHMHANRPTQIVGGDGKIKTVSWAIAWHGDRHRREYDGIEFFPNPDGAEATPGYFNLWRGFAVKPRPKRNGYHIFEDHLRTNVCGGDRTLFTWLFAWFADLVQRPRERPGTAVVLRGKMGTGKTKVGEVIGSLFPAHYFLVDDPRYVTGQFNAHMASCLLLQAEEAVWAGDKAAEGRLKGLITSRLQMIEQKGIDPIRLDNHVRLLMTSNEGWVVPAGKDERRFCVLDVADHVTQNHEYFAEMDRELDEGGREALLHDLMTFDLSKVNLRSIPRTDALLEQKIRSLDTVESWWFERLSAGETTSNAGGWRRQIAAEDLFNDYLSNAERIGVRRKTEANVFGIKLRRIVPNIERRRVSVDDGPSSTRRVWAYDMPDLGACRRAFEEQIGQPVTWDDPDA